MAEVVGYKLENSNGDIVQQWGGQWGQCPGIPNPLTLPDGRIVHGARPGENFGEWSLVELTMDSAPPPPVPDEISDRQFFQQLALLGSITHQEALDAVKTGAIPAAIQGFVDTLPDEQKFAAQMLLSGATVFKRSHPMTAMLGYGLGLSDEQMDGIWLAASQL